MLRDAVEKWWDAEIWEQHKGGLSRECVIEEINKRVKLTDFGHKEINLYNQLHEAVQKDDDKTKFAAAAEIVKMNENKEKKK